MKSTQRGSAKKPRKTVAMSIIEARHDSYGHGMFPTYMDETDLLLMSQHYGELKARKAKKGKANAPHRR